MLPIRTIKYENKQNLSVTFTSKGVLTSGWITILENIYYGGTGLLLKFTRENVKFKYLF